MQTAIIYVFSGTYNTLKTAGFIKGTLEERGVKATVCEVRKPLEAIPSPEGFDYVGFGYPVYAYNAPKFFLDFVKTLPEGRQAAFIFKTSGEPFRMNNASSSGLIRALRSKGYDVRLESHMLMPYNIIFRYPDALAKQMWLYTRAQGELLAKRLLAGERDGIRFGPGRWTVALLFRLQWFGSWINGPLFRTKKKKCNLCGKCARSCPAGNISIRDGKVRFGWRCTMCMRCAMLCPKDAVRAGLINPLKVHGAYNFERILSDPDISPDFVCEGTKGYFRLFREFFKKADAQLAAYGISVLPQDEDEEEETMAQGRA